MAYIVNWTTREINIPIGDLILVSGNEYNLDLENCHDELRRLESEFNEGLFAPQILDYVLPYTVSGSTSVGALLIINNYTFIFPVACDAVNLIGANTNMGDLIITPANGVSIRPTNSFGNTITQVGSGLSNEQDEKLTNIDALSQQIDLLVDELHTIKGLNASRPLRSTKTSIVAGDIELNVTGDGVNESIATRGVVPSRLIDENGDYVIDESGNYISG